MPSFPDLAGGIVVLHIVLLEREAFGYCVGNMICNMTVLVPYPEERMPLEILNQEPVLRRRE